MALSRLAAPTAPPVRAVGVESGPALAWVECTSLPWLTGHLAGLGRAAMLAERVDRCTEPPIGPAVGCPRLIAMRACATALHGTVRSHSPRTSTTGPSGQESHRLQTPQAGSHCR